MNSPNSIRKKNKIMKAKNEYGKDTVKKLYAVNCNYCKEIPNYEWLMVPVTFAEKEIPPYMCFEMACFGILEKQNTFTRLLIHNIHPCVLPVPQPEANPLF